MIAQLWIDLFVGAAALGLIGMFCYAVGWLLVERPKIFFAAVFIIGSVMTGVWIRGL